MRGRLNITIAGYRRSQKKKRMNRDEVTGFDRFHEQSRLRVPIAKTIALLGTSIQAYEIYFRRILDGGIVLRSWHSKNALIDEA